METLPELFLEAQLCHYPTALHLRWNDVTHNFLLALSDSRPVNALCISLPPALQELVDWWVGFVRATVGPGQNPWGVVRAPRIATDRCVETFALFLRRQEGANTVFRTFLVSVRHHEECARCSQMQECWIPSRKLAIYEVSPRAFFRGEENARPIDPEFLPVRPVKR